MKQLYATSLPSLSKIPSKTLFMALLALAVNTATAFAQSSTSDVKSFYPASVQSFLPGTLVNWTATLDNNKVNLTWITTVEKNTLHFTVEKSFNGQDYQEAAILFAAGNSDMRKQYVFSEKVSINVNKVIYYRLKMVDRDANVKFSDVRVVRSNKPDGVMMELSPNPAVNDLKVTISSTWVNQELMIEVCNINGVVVKRKLNEKAKETETVNVRDLVDGMYIVRVSNGKEISLKQFVKN